MTTFSNASKFKIAAETTIRIELPIVLDGEHPVVLICAPASELNKPLLNETLRRVNAKNSTNLRAGRTRRDIAAMTPMQQIAEMDSSRDEDRELYAEFVVRGWEHVVDDAGKVPEFKPSEVLDLLKAIPDEIFDEVRKLCIDMDKFRAAKTETTAKN